MNAEQRVAWNIRRLRIARGISQEVLAFEAGVDRTYVSRLERCSENPTVNVLERLAQALGRDIVDLFEIPERGSKAPLRLKSGPKPGQKRR